LTRRRARASLAMTSWRALLECARSDRYFMGDCLATWRRAVRVRREEEAELRHFWWCCEQSNVKAAEAVAKLAARVFHTWRSYTLRQVSRRMSYASAVEAARLRPVRVAFILFQAASQRRGQQRRAKALIVSVQRCLERNQSSALRRWQAVDRSVQMTMRKDQERKSFAFKAWIKQASVRRRIEAGAQLLHRLPFTCGFLALLRFRHGEAPPVKLQNEIRSAEGLALRCLRSQGRAFLLAWQLAARQEFLSSRLLRWRRSAAVLRSTRRRRCKWPLQQWRKWTTKAMEARQTTSLARRYATRRLLQQVVRRWALAKHGQIPRGNYVLPSFQSSWCAFQNSRWLLEGRGRPDSLVLWSPAMGITASS